MRTIDGGRSGDAKMHVRSVDPRDAPEIREIYARHVREGAGTFEEEPPSEADIESRIASVMALGLPFLTAEADSRVVGFSYANLFRDRSAFRHTIEDSVYVAADAIGRGIGFALLADLIARCEGGPWRQMVAVIGDSANAASIGVHRKCGFEMVGVLSGVGFKFGRWIDAPIMQRALVTPSQPQDFKR